MHITMVLYTIQSDIIDSGNQKDIYMKGWYIAVFAHFWLDTTYFMTVNT